MGDLLKKRCDDLGPPVMLPHQETMIGVHKQQRIRPEIIFIKRIKHPVLLSDRDGRRQPTVGTFDMHVARLVVCIRTGRSPPGISVSSTPCRLV